MGAKTALGVPTHHSSALKIHISYTSKSTVDNFRRGSPYPSQLSGNTCETCHQVEEPEIACRPKNSCEKTPGVEERPCTKVPTAYLHVCSSKRHRRESTVTITFRAWLRPTRHRLVVVLTAHQLQPPSTKKHHASSEGETGWPSSCTHPLEFWPGLENKQ